MRIITFISCLFFLCACSPDKEQTLNIATAANVQFAMKDLCKEFTKSTNIKCNIITGSSGKLTTQIIEGAPYHIFLSANLKYPNKIYKAGISTDKPEVYAHGKLVVWSMKNEGTLPINLSYLDSEEIKHIAIANPKIAPYGQAALEALKFNKLYPSVKPKLVFGESISQVNQFIYSQTAEIGFTSLSVVLSPTMRNKGTWMEVDKNSYSRIEQGVIILKSTEEKEKDSEKFYKFLFSETAQKILIEHGYNRPR